MLRASSYNIYVPLPDNSEELLILHGYTGAYDRVSVDVATYLKNLEMYERPKPLFGKWSDEQLGLFVKSKNSDFRPSDSTLAALKLRGYLTENSFEEEEKRIGKIANTLHEESRKPSYVVMPTYNCNLRCAYCFQDHMRTNRSNSSLLKSMNVDMANRIIAVMGNIEKSKGWTSSTPPRRGVTFFGGEPLLKITKPVINHFIKNLKASGEAAFSAVTNGTELHHYEDLIGPEGINFLQITLDGPPVEHDKRRIYPNGKGSFEIIAENISRCLDQKAFVSVRMNIDRNNIQTLPTLAKEFIDRGWDSSKYFSSYVSPIQKANDNVDESETFNSYELNVEIEQLKTDFSDVMKVVRDCDDPLTERLRKVFYKKGFPMMQSTFCAAHNEMFVFDAFGDIYACWEVTGDKKLRIGAIKEDGDIEIANELYTMWRKRNISTNPVCNKCRYALYCGGGCAVLAERENGTVFSNFCDAFGKRFNSKLAKVYTDYTDGIETSDKVERICSQ